VGAVRAFSCYCHTRTYDSANVYRNSGPTDCYIDSTHRNSGPPDSRADYDSSTADGACSQPDATGNTHLRAYGNRCRTGSWTHIINPRGNSD
jgi:hypothetical protein